MGKKTPLFDLHRQANAKIVDFAGWEMPLHYGSQIEEHHQVRKHAGLFDVSHMGIVDLHGRDTLAYLRQLLANDAGRLYPGKALYTCMLNENGGILDDLIVCKIADDFFRVIVNAGTREKDLRWMKLQTKAEDKAGFNIEFVERNDLVMLAIQGPEVKAKLSEFFSIDQVKAAHDLKPFHFIIMDSLFIARTGYTGEDGFEIILSTAEAPPLWARLLAAHIKPCGLGARDTLRLEAGLNLFGSDMNESVTPYVSNLGWTVAMEPKSRNFIGRDALEKHLAAGVNEQLVGLILNGPGIMRNHQKVIANDIEVGEITSGGYSPTLEKSIALARIFTTLNGECSVMIRDKQVPAIIVKPPFVRNGRKMF